jgi:ATP-dependent exoDNAse (exonuclease V) beta subunit
VLSGKLYVEEPVTLPLDVDGQRITISGRDLVHETPTHVEIIDYKTDSTRHAQPEYHKQPSVYCHVIDEWFENKDVTATLFYTNTGTREEIEPLTLAELRSLVT